MPIQSGGIQEKFPLGSYREADPNWWDKWGPVVEQTLGAIGQLVGGYFGGAAGGKFGQEGGENQGKILSRMLRDRPERMEHYKEAGFTDEIKIGGQSGRSPATERLGGQKKMPGGRDVPLSKLLSSNDADQWRLQQMFGEGQPGRYKLDDAGMLNQEQKGMLIGGEHPYDDPNTLQSLFGGQQQQAPQMQAPQMQGGAMGGQTQGPAAGLQIPTEQGGGDQNQVIQAIIAALMEQEGGGQQGGGMMSFIQQIMGGMGQGGAGAGGGAGASPGMMDYMSTISTY